jgi:hypothetical protein
MQAGSSAGLGPELVEPGAVKVRYRVEKLWPSADGISVPVRVVLEDQVLTQ